ncbi:MAG: KUP/HAK/KT family potassium transporter [Akkermansia sp.]
MRYLGHFYAMNSPLDKKPIQLALWMGALGVVFGDVGTSPLYTMKQCLLALPEGMQQTNVVTGIVSLIFWAISLVICIKYSSNILKADNHGEGGIFALLALSGLKEKSAKHKGGLSGGIILILISASLLFGESVITPAITVLSATEGLKGFDIGITQGMTILIATGILILLFSLQKYGTQFIGKIFGPIMFCWFVLLGLLGIWNIVQCPRIILALNPWYGIKLLTGNILPLGVILILLGSVVLALTGVEALFANMGHFGRKAITKAWYFVAMPGLVLNYFGQGAHVLNHPGSQNPFFELLPAGWPQGTLSVISIIAAVIASQAIISGAYSLTLSAVQLGYFPRLKILHTNAQIHGQIYIPLINFTLAVCSIAIVLAFKTSEGLAAAYSVAVTGSMVITTYAFYHVARNHWGWKVSKALPLCIGFWLIDGILVISSLHKFAEGGWIAVAIGLLFFLIMHTWKSGRMAVNKVIDSSALMELSPTDIVKNDKLIRVPGCAIFLSSSPQGIPIVLAHHLKSNKCLHKTAVILALLTSDAPFIERNKRIKQEDLGNGLWRASAIYGCMEHPSMIEIIELLQEQGVPLKPNDTSFYFNREVIITGGHSNLLEWQKSLYEFLSRNARPVKDYYRVTPTRIVEMGLPISL